MVNIHEAKSTLSALLARVEQGEDIVIARNGQPIARLTRMPATANRAPGTWRSLPGWENFTYNPALFAAMTEAEMTEEGWP